jgi:dihydropyrimidinase
MTILNNDFDMTIRGGRISTYSKTFYADIGIKDGVIVSIQKDLPPGRRDIDATGRWVLPGGIDSHVHIEQRSGMGMMCADDFYSGTVSAAFGGTTTVIPFAAQHRGKKIPNVIVDYAQLAREKAVIDYGFHLILSDPDEVALKQDLPKAIRDGITSLKVYMTYDQLKLSDYQLLDVMALAGSEGALVMIHAENHDMIRWIAERLLDLGHTAPKFHAVAHDSLVESEASQRAIVMSRLIDVPVLLVHVAGAETVELIRSAQQLGSKVYAESCPQYMFLTAKDIDLPGVEGAKFCCSPPPGDERSQEAIWAGLKDGTLCLYSSDHAPYRMDESGKLPKGETTNFKEMANGVPGIELRMPLLFSEGVMTGRISIQEFIALTATNHARMYGLSHCKGDLEVGMDADLALWNPEREITVDSAMLHDNVGYTPYQGRRLRGWPELVMSRGRIVVQDNALQVERGSGQYIPRRSPEPTLSGKKAAYATRLPGLLGLKGKAWPTQ